jgi:hypothetical protein
MRNKLAVKSKIFYAQVLAFVAIGENTISVDLNEPPSCKAACHHCCLAMHCCPRAAGL